MQYRVNTGGTRSLTMKASADGTNYGAGYTQTFVYDTPAKLTVGSTAQGSLLEPYTYTYFSFCPSASGNFTFYSTGNVKLQATLYDDDYNIISYDGCYMHGSSAYNFELTEGLSRSKNYFLEVELFGADAEGGTFRVGVR